MTATPEQLLAITGVGLVTSVGSSALATVAALRAGIARFREVPGAQILDRSGTRAEAIIAAESAMHAGEPFQTLGAALIAAAMADAGAGGCAWETDAGHWLRAGGAPENAYPLRHIGILDRLVECAATLPSAPIGLAAADSLATAAALHHYAGAGRLKGSTSPSGFVPGEAAAALVVESVTSARTGGRPVLAVIEAWGRGHEPVPLGGAAPSLASGLTEALAEALGSRPVPDLIVVDLNGERARSLEWGLAAPRALPFAEGTLACWTPADGVGECGRATGLLLAGCAAVALARGLAERALVVASDDSGARCAVVLRAADRLGPTGGRA